MHTKKSSFQTPSRACGPSSRSYSLALRLLYFPSVPVSNLTLSLFENFALDSHPWPSLDPAFHQLSISAHDTILIPVSIPTTRNVLGPSHRPALSASVVTGDTLRVPAHPQLALSTWLPHYPYFGTFACPWLFAQFHQQCYPRCDAPARPRTRSG